MDEFLWEIDTEEYWFMKTTNGHGSGDHLLQFVDKSVNCKGEFNKNQSIRFKMYTGSWNGSRICVLKCVSDPYEDQCLSISNGVVSHEEFDIKSTTPIGDVPKDLLFEYEIVNQNQYSFRLASGDPKLVLGFTDEGDPNLTYAYGSENTLLVKQQVP